MSVNVEGVFFCTKHAIPYLRIDAMLYADRRHPGSVVDGGDTAR